jgi:hypothetical protein
MPSGFATLLACVLSPHPRFLARLPLASPAGGYSGEAQNGRATAARKVLTMDRKHVQWTSHPTVSTWLRCATSQHSMPLPGQYSSASCRRARGFRVPRCPADRWGALLGWRAGGSRKNNLFYVSKTVGVRSAINPPMRTVHRQSLLSRLDALPVTSKLLLQYPGNLFVQLASKLEFLPCEHFCVHLVSLWFATRAVSVRMA